MTASTSSAALLEQWLSIVASALTVLAILLGALLTRRFWLRRGIVAGRRRARRHVGCPVRIRRRADVLRVAAITAGRSLSVQDEVAWLSQCLTPPPHARQGDLTGATLVELCSTQELQSLARAYAEHAGRLASRVLLGTSLPAVERAASLADATSTYLLDVAGSAGSSPSTPSGTPDGDKVTSTPVRMTVRDRGVELALHVYPGCLPGHLAFDVLSAHRDHVTAVEWAGSPWLPPRSARTGPGRTAPGLTLLPMTDEEADRLADTFRTGHVFDGLLPRLRSHVVTRDRQSGRGRLLLSTAACSYSAVVLDHYPGPGQLADRVAGMNDRAFTARGVSTTDVSGSRVGVLTLSMVPVTADGYLVLARRSGRAGSHEHRIGPGVNGNLELGTRFGVRVDAGPTGVPDVLVALVREASEELGLALDRSQVSCTGLGTFSAPTEVNTNVLIATVMLPQTLDELAARTHRADLIEGRWELGQHLLGLQLPRTDEPASGSLEADEQVRWLLGCTELTPHATLAGLCSLAVALGDEEVLTRARSISEAGVRTFAMRPEPWLREVRMR